LAYENEIIPSGKQFAWQKHFEKCHRSGLSQSAYCKQHNLVESQFYYWKKQLGLTPNPSAPTTKSNKVDFVPVQIAPKKQQSIVIHLNNGISIEGYATHSDDMITMIKALSTL